ncbi:hypothetical protein SK128_000382 [Halocaridina rubra]|uniref:TMEM248/TMEM219 domain-containing protein n=1 Tax=Halocaridina rubra TaxID=373956 RepID=A0AAN8XCX7_HALRR
MCLNISSKPPLAVFAATIVGFVLALISVSLYLQSHKAQILNPDVKNWNSFYETLSDMDICFPNSTKMSSLPPRLQSGVALGNETEDTNITFSIFADVHVEREGKTMENQILHALINSTYLGFKGDTSVLEITLELAKDTAKNWTACVTVFGPSHLLPDSPYSPPKCTPSKRVNAYDIEMAQPWMVPDGARWCSAGVLGGLRVAAQDELNVYLSEGEVTTIQLHILYTTCLLCVMMIGLLFYFIFGKRNCSKAKTLHTLDKIPLHP